MRMVFSMIWAIGDLLGQVALKAWTVTVVIGLASGGTSIPPYVG